MKNYFVKIKAMLPYPVEREYREGASNMATAVARAIRRYRKELNGKRIKDLLIKVVKI